MTFLRYGFVALAALVASTAVAQDYPVKSIRFIVPFAPGGGNDVIARVIGQKLSQHWGPQVIVDNRPGAGGNLAAETTAHSAPDGYTLFQFNIANAIAVGIYKKLGYDPVKDFAAITELASSPFFLVVHPSVNAHNVVELIALAKAQPGKLNYASSGNGGSSHLAMELFKSMAGVTLVHVPYNGSGPALTDTISNQVQVLFTVPVAALPHIRGNRVRALGVSERTRSALLPDLPTIAESGLPGYESSAWYGVVAPAHTPPAIINKLNVEIVRILHEPDVKERMAALGAETVGSSPEQFAAFIKSEIAKWVRIVKISGAKVE